jgi:putative nucleotidyltransferase with HDIG domain
MRRWRCPTTIAIADCVRRFDEPTARHHQRVADLAGAMAEALNLAEERMRGLYLAGILHDVGKMALPSDILGKPAALSRAECRLVQGHVEAGYGILSNVHLPSPVAEIVRQHHERLDGSGYPRALAGDAIVPEARILAVADSVDAILAHRPYRRGREIAVALSEIEAGKGRLYDAPAVDACVALFNERGVWFLRFRAAGGHLSDVDSIIHGYSR